MSDMFGLAPLKIEGSISIIVDDEDVEDGNKYAINNAKDKLIMFCAKVPMCPVFTEISLGYGTQIIATRREKL